MPVYIQLRIVTVSDTTICPVLCIHLFASVAYIDYKCDCPLQAEFLWGNHTELLFHFHHCWEQKSKILHNHHYHPHNHQQEL